MTTTTITTGHERTPLLAVLAVGAAFVVGSAIGVALEQDSSTAASHSPAYQHSYTRYFYWVAPADRAIVATPTGGTTASEEFSGTTHPYPRGWSAFSPSTSTPKGYETSRECRGCVPGR